MANENNLPARILIVDDDPTVAQGLEESLGRYNISILKAADLQTAMYHFNQVRLEVVLVEVEFAPLPGLALVQKWRQHEMQDKRLTSFIMMSGSSRTAAEDGLIRELGDLEIIMKPFTAIQILPVISRAFANRQRTAQFFELKSRLVEPYERRGDLNKAVEQVHKQMANLGPRGLPLLIDLYEKAGQYEQALAVVTGMLEKDNNNIALIGAKGRLLLRLGKVGEAKEYMERADKAAPSNIDRINEMATMYLKLKDPTNSLKKMREFVALNPEHEDVKFEMFSRLYEHGFDEQATSFGRSVSKPMEIVRHYNNKGVMLSKDGNVAAALTEYKRALKFFPKFKENYRIHYNIGLACAQMKTSESLKEAEENLTVCLELEPDFEKAKKALETVQKATSKKVG